MRPTLLAVALSLAGAVSAPALFAADLPDKADVARDAAALLADALPSDGPGAVVLVARGDEILFQHASGQADIEAGTALDVDDTFRIGSVTKQFAAAGLLKLVEAGKVSLDDPLSKFLPDFPNGAAITVRQLLNHTSGIKSYTGIPGYMVDGIRADLTTPELIAVFKDLPVDFAPGADWAYNNSGYVLVGAVIEAASGQPWHEYLEDQFFEPLGMDATGYGADPAVVAGQVHGYTFDGEKAIPAMQISMTQPHAAGALVSSVQDLLVWNRALHEGNVLAPESYELMVTPVGAAVDDHYGFGLTVGTVRGEPMLQHGGGIHGFASYLLYLPGTDTTVAVLQNADQAIGSFGPSSAAHKLAAVAIGDPYPAPVAIDVDIATLEEAQGVYRVNSEHERILRVVDGKLTGQRTGGMPAALTPIAKDTYLYDDGFNRFELLRDDAGKITGMRFFPDGEGDGEIAPLTDKPLPEPRVALELSPEAVTRVSGTYATGPMTLKIYQEGDRMMALMSGQQPVEIFAETPDSFYLTVVPATLEFAPGDVAPTLVLKQNGQEIEFTRAP